MITHVFSVWIGVYYTYLYIRRMHTWRNIYELRVDMDILQHIHAESVGTNKHTYYIKTIVYMLR